MVFLVFLPERAEIEVDTGELLCKQAYFDIIRKEKIPDFSQTQKETLLIVNK
jgi:hypothetical protein